MLERTPLMRICLNQMWAFLPGFVFSSTAQGFELIAKLPLGSSQEQGEACAHHALEYKTALSSGAAGEVRPWFPWLEVQKVLHSLLRRGASLKGSLSAPLMGMWGC